MNNRLKNYIALKKKLEITCNFKLVYILQKLMIKIILNDATKICKKWKNKTSVY